MQLHIIAVILLSFLTFQRYQAVGGGPEYQDDLEYYYEPVVVADISDVTSAAPAPSSGTTTTTAATWDPDKAYKLDDKTYNYNYNNYDNYDNSYNGKNYKNNNYNNNYADNDDYDKSYESANYRSKRRYRSPDKMGHLNIYIRDSPKRGKKGKSQKIRFPAAQYSRDHYPRQFGRLMSFLPWVPIFVDRLTKQTIIHSPTGGIIIIPPVINFYGKLYSVAELIASGYASLVSSGVPPPPAVDVGPLVQPGAVVGPGIPPFDRSTGGFSGGVRTQLRAKFPTQVN